MVRLHEKESDADLSEVVHLVGAICLLYTSDAADE